MKVCHFITRMIVGGAQENTFLSARGLVEAGHECVLLTGPSKGREGCLLTRWENPGFSIVESPLFVREISPWTDLKAILWLADYFKREKFDVVHTHTSKAGIVGRIAGRMAKVPLVVHTIHGLAFGPYESFLKNQKTTHTKVRWKSHPNSFVELTALSNVCKCIAGNMRISLNDSTDKFTILKD